MSMSSCTHPNNNNFTPIIGILCIDIATELRDIFGNDYYSYIAASYVKYLESAGARVIPIWIKRPRSYYKNIMTKINGILIPGGAVYFDRKYCTKDLRNDCVESSKYIYEIAKELSEKGQPFPLWGTCMGFQLLLTHSASLAMKCESDKSDQFVEIRRDCHQMNCSLPVKFESDKVLSSSKIFANLNTDLKLKMSSQPFGIHFHRYCITKEDLHIYKIDQLWKVLACNNDEKGVEFITIVEHNSLPFYGSQIHPERVIFENYESNGLIHHCLQCFELAQYFAKFFVQQCYLNGNRFDNIQEESRYFIHNFPIVLYAKDDNTKFRQYYLFKENDDYPLDLNK